MYNSSKLQRKNILDCARCNLGSWNYIVLWTFVCFDLYKTKRQENVYSFLFIGIIYQGKLRSLSLTTTYTTYTMFLQVSSNLLKKYQSKIIEE